MVVVLSTWESSRRGGGRVAVRLESTSYWCTYQRHRVMLGPEILVDVPAALCERWAQGVRRKSGHPPQGNQPENWWAERRSFVSGNPAVFFNTAGTPEQVSKELYVVSAWLVLRPAWLDFDFALFSFTPSPFSSLVAFRSSARSLPPIASGVSFTSAYLGRLFVDANMGPVSTSTTQTMARCVDARRR